jgi:hypothetical protein
MSSIRVAVGAASRPANRKRNPKYVVTMPTGIMGELVIVATKLPCRARSTLAKMAPNVSSRPMTIRSTETGRLVGRKYTVPQEKHYRGRRTVNLAPVDVANEPESPQFGQCQAIGSEVFASEFAELSLDGSISMAE